MSAVRAALVLVVALGVGACDDGVPHEFARSIAAEPPHATSASPQPPPLVRLPPPANLVVHGVGLGEHRRSFALISAGSAPPAMVEVGDTLGEERLVQIGDDFVVMESRGSTRKIPVGGRVKPVGPPAATPPRAAAAPDATTVADDLRSNRAFEAFLRSPQGAR